MKINYKNNSNGFVLLYAVLVTVVVVTVGVIIMNIITKQIILSSIGKNSQLAFYAATAGVECAKYWDAPADDFTSHFGDVVDDGTGPKFIVADNRKIVCGKYSDNPVNTGGLESFSAKWTIPFDWGGCTNVLVTKDINGMEIRSQGYNIGTKDLCPAVSPRLTERTLIVKPTATR